MNFEAKRHLLIDIEHNIEATLILPADLIECGRGDFCDLIERHSLDGSHIFLQYPSPNRIYLIEWQRKFLFFFKFLIVLFHLAYFLCVINIS